MIATRHRRACEVTVTGGHALLRDSQGRPSTPLGAALDCHHRDGERPMITNPSAGGIPRMKEDDTMRFRVERRTIDTWHGVIERWHIIREPKPFPNEEAHKVVEAGAWQEELKRSNALDGNISARFKELRKGLAARNLIGSRDDLVWAISRTP
jgi:hypothetical protein